MQQSQDRTASDRIVVLSISALGDFIVAIPLLQQIRRVYPDSQISLVCLAPEVAAAARQLDAADNVVQISRRARRSPAQLVSSLATIRKLRTDIAFQTASSYGTFANLLVGASGARIRCGFALGRLQGNLTHAVPIDFHRHRVALNLDLLRRLGHLDVSEPDGRFLPFPSSGSNQGVAELLPADIGPYVIISSGSGAKLQFKRWPGEKWASLSKMLDEAGIAQVFVGSSSERIGIDNILAQSQSKSFNLAGETSLVDLSRLIESSLAVVGTDGMALHLASALGKPCVGIFGPTAPGVVGPWGAIHTRLALGLPCSPCYGGVNEGKPISCKTQECLHAMPVRMVFDAVMAQCAAARLEAAGRTIPIPVFNRD